MIVYTTDHNFATIYPNYLAISTGFMTVNIDHVGPELVVWYRLVLPDPVDDTEDYTVPDLDAEDDVPSLVPDDDDSDGDSMLSGTTVGEEEEIASRVGLEGVNVPALIQDMYRLVQEGRWAEFVSGGAYRDDLDDDDDDEEEVLPNDTTLVWEQGGLPERGNSGEVASCEHPYASEIEDAVAEVEDREKDEEDEEDKEDTGCFDNDGGDPIVHEWCDVVW